MSKSDFRYIPCPDGRAMLFIYNCGKHLSVVDVNNEHQISGVMFDISQEEGEKLALDIQFGNQFHKMEMKNDVS
tara:strand:- start:127 stop:348 length:222 start_codon:yes stop_codon:yes gene_type:complete